MSALLIANLGWLKETPITKFGKEDHKTVAQTLNKALDGGQDGVPVTAAHNSGSVTPSPDPQGRAGCRKALIENRHPTLSNSMEIVFCKKDGKWKQAPN